MLDALFKPRSVAVVGASNNPFNIGHIVIQNLVDHGYKGPIYPINPKSKHIKSFRAYPSVLDVPDDIDLANISIKNTLVPSVIEDCGKKGVKFAIIHTGGFKEIGEEGLAIEKEILRIAHKYGMRIYGPNSQGIQNSDPEISVYANFTFAPMSPGNIAIVAQSGGVGETLKLNMYKKGVGLRKYASFGNEADVSMNEILDYYGQDEGTRVIMVQIGTLLDPAGFLEVASRVSQIKPILALKSGKTPEGVVAEASHTGTLLEQDTLTDVLFHKSGVIRFHSQEDIIEAAIAFSTQPIPRGNRVIIVTNTGGPAIIALDECILGGLKLAKLSAPTRKALSQILFKEATISNPVDILATAGPEQFEGTFKTLLADKNIDSILLNYVTAPFTDCEGIGRKLAEIGRIAEKPIVCQVMTIERWAEVVRLIRESGIPVYDYGETAARALAAMTQYGQSNQKETPTYRKFRKEKKKTEAILSKHKGKEKFLPQGDVFDLLKCYGIPTAKTFKVKTKKDLIKAAQDVGFPLALKVDAESIVHKSDVGGVALGIKDEEALLSAHAKMVKKFAEAKPAFIVQEYLQSGKEVIMGSKGNEGLAPTIMFGLGGVFVEVLKDVQFRLAPLSGEEALEMISTIKGFPILKGTRGEKPADVDSLVDILIRFSQLVTDYPVLDEADLNPVFAFPKGKGAAVVDARIKIKKL